MKTCRVCKIEKQYSEFHKAKGGVGGVAATCKDCRNEKNAQWTRANRDVVNAAAARRRLEALKRYSSTAEPSCACCGESILAFLTFEHINGGGSAHRRETGGGGFVSWLRRNDYPEGFEVLCMNCNLGRRVSGGTCPHERS